jgi:hypothetical protein
MDKVLWDLDPTYYYVTRIIHDFHLVHLYTQQGFVDVHQVDAHDTMTDACWEYIGLMSPHPPLSILNMHNHCSLSYQCSHTNTSNT